MRNGKRKLRMSKQTLKNVNQKPGKKRARGLNDEKLGKLQCQAERKMKILNTYNETLTYYRPIVNEIKQEEENAKSKGDILTAESAYRVRKTIERRVSDIEQIASKLDNEITRMGELIAGKGKKVYNPH